MAFNFGSSNPAGGNGNFELGPELPEGPAEEVGFKGVDGDSNIRILSTPWPQDALPAPTASLLAVAPTKGILVAAGPDSLSVASTESIRAAISAPTEGKVKTKPFQPQATISLPARPTHITFASNDTALLLATENGAQLSVFETASLTSGNAQPALSIPTNGTTFRTIAANPAQELSSLVALVTTGGDLLVADLKAGNLVSGPNGQVLKSGVSSVCWSNKGKQLVAGLADGTGFQMTPDGTQKDLIPRPSDLEGDCHVSSIAWLENDIFLTIYTPNTLEDDMGGNPPSSYYIITRRKQAPFLIQRLPELCSPWGYKRTPAFQFIARLRDYKPHLKDVLILSSTACADIGLITRADQPLVKSDTVNTAGVFVTTEVSDDSKRASVPLSDSGDETSVIGLGLDLSSKENVITPIPGADIEESSTPLPNFLLLNHEGILCSWWFLYSDAIRQKVLYQGMADQMQAQAQQTPQAPQAQPSSFGQSGFGGASGFGSSAFGSPAAPSFGSPSAQAAPQKPAFGASSFGSPSQQGPAFGQSGFAALGGGSSGFGQPSTPGKGLSSLSFAQSGTGSGGGFGAFAPKTGGGFGAFASTNQSSTSLFAQAASSESPLTKASNASPFGGQSSMASAFGAPKTSGSTGSFGLGSSPFVVGSTFKSDGSAANDLPKPDKPSGMFSFSESMDDMMSSSTKTSPPNEEMDDMEDESATPQQKPGEKGTTSSLFGQTSTATSAPKGLFGAPSEPTTSAPKGLFGAPSQPTTSAAPKGLFGAPSAPASSASKSMFGSPSTTTTSTPRSPFTSQPISNPFGQQASKPGFSLFGSTTPAKSPLAFSTSADSTTPSKEQSEDDARTPSATPQGAPLPPDPISKASYGPGDTSASSNVSKSSVDDAPLPPDFTTSKLTTKEAAAEAPLPPDFTKIGKKADDENEGVGPEEAPLPPDFSIPKPRQESEDVAPVPDESDGEDYEGEDDGSEEGASDEEEESDFADSGEDITNDISPSESNEPSPKALPKGSFKPGAQVTGGLFSPASKPPSAPQPQPSRSLFGAMSNPKFPALQNRELPRSPSPVRGAAPNRLFNADGKKGVSAPQSPGSALTARKASLTEHQRRESQLKPKPARKELSQQELRARQLEEEAQVLSDDDEDERLRADLALPLEPVPTLDPFLPHHDYAGETSKPGIPGQIERLYRDINSMVDTLGINVRSLSSFLLYQKQSKDPHWVDTLQQDNATDILDKELVLCEIEKFDDAVAMLAASLEQQRVQGVEEKLEKCRELLSKDIITLRGQCASIRKTLDAHTDTTAIHFAPLSAEHANLQQDLRSASTEVQAKLADLESAVTLLRAKIADVPPLGGSRQTTRRPTVEAVTTTIHKMMEMAESKRSDIDVLEAQLKRLGVDTTAPAASREGSPFTTPKKNAGRLPATPGSRGSIDGPYHTPDSANRALAFRSSINGSARASRLRNVEGVQDLVSSEETAQYKAKVQRKQRIVESLRSAIEAKKNRVRTLNDL
ncbi:FG-nucleoporin NUP159 [Aspergillus saccharolyticus JOP 1030-1]|uniref:Nucleoporin Nup159/Nup146 N-terminal domain-containing protein n=1 Tax=Aspergillus saccharolyticus JOP 1030-1 TaxID=1450539 RepID=A0A318ZQ61_9EURO|nr:hypothetical protein BP01DRAFT_422521 [Aspergillus saccharolyticus JOP 1030-1]PYH46553.1 hypothetical protein BP01DRAFT_422521 [Aspergillus saccharolyticus JOP 1030-1]